MDDDLDVCLLMEVFFFFSMTACQLQNLSCLNLQADSTDICMKQKAVTQALNVLITLSFSVSVLMYHFRHKEWGVWLSIGSGSFRTCQIWSRLIEQCFNASGFLTDVFLSIVLKLTTIHLGKLYWKVNSLCCVACSYYCSRSNKFNERQRVLWRLFSP